MGPINCAPNPADSGLFTFSATLDLFMYHLPMCSGGTMKRLIGHELTEIRDDSPRFARFSLTIVIKRPIHASGTSVRK